MKPDEVCANCGKESQNLQDTDRGLICLECLENSMICEHCDSTIFEEEASYSVDDEIVCSSCFDDANECEDCGKITFESLTSVNSRGRSYDVCDNCLHGNYTPCDSCGDWFNPDDLIYCRSCEEHRCEDCACDCKGDAYYDTRGCNHTVKTCSTKGKIIDIPVAVGVEIEAEALRSTGVYLNDLIPSECGIAEDGSLSEGVEIQTPPRMMIELEKVIELSCAGLKKAGFGIDRSCGLHIHLDARKLNSKTVRNFMALHLLSEDYIFQCLPSSRRNNSYCKHLSSIFKLSDILSWKSFAECERFFYFSQAFPRFLVNYNHPLAWNGSITEYKKTMSDYNTQHKKSYGEIWKKEFKKWTEYSKSCHYNDKRYSCVNLHSFFTRKTIELRHHNGTLESEKILHWIDLNLHLLKLAETIDRKTLLTLDGLAPTIRFKFIAKKAGCSKKLMEYLSEQYNKFN